MESSIHRPQWKKKLQCIFQDLVRRQSSIWEIRLSYLLGHLVPGPGNNTAKYK